MADRTAPNKLFSFIDKIMLALSQKTIINAKQILSQIHKPFLSSIFLDGTFYDIRESFGVYPL